MTATNLHISKIKISNILGIDELEFSPGQFTKLTGANGSGKTSVLEAIKAALKGGHDGTLLRSGAEKGEVVLILGDGTEIKKRVTATASDTKVIQNGKTVTRPGERLNALADLISVNPVEFLRASKKDRVQVLLKAMPIKVDIERIGRIAGMKVGPDMGALGLPALDAVKVQVFDERTNTNREAKQKASTISQLRLAMPEAPGGVEGDEDSLRGQLGAAKDTRDAETTRIDDKLVGVRAEIAERIRSLNETAQAAIQAIKDQLEADIKIQRDGLADTEAKAGRVRQRAIDAYNAAAQPLEIAIGTIAANRDAAAKRKVSIETIETLTAEQMALEEEAATQTQALADLDAYKSELLDGLPIKGLQVIDGDILRDGVQFDRLNTAQQVEIAVEVAKLRAGPLGVICVDGLELLDGPHFEAFQAAALASGLQLFVTRVGDGEFSIDGTAAN